MAWSKQMRSTDFQRNIGETLDDVRRHHVPVVVTAHGRPIVVLVPYEEWSEFQRWQIEHDRLERMRDAANVIP